MKPTYTYTAKKVRVIDGDTIVVRVDLGFFASIELALRLYWINAPEVVGETRPAGLAAKEHLDEITPNTITIKTFKNPGDKYGRWLAEIFDADGASINMRMVEDGHATFAPKIGREHSEAERYA